MAYQLSDASDRPSGSPGGGTRGARGSRGVCRSRENSLRWLGRSQLRFRLKIQTITVRASSLTTLRFSPSVPVSTSLEKVKETNGDGVRDKYDGGRLVGTSTLGREFFA